MHALEPALGEPLSPEPGCPIAQAAEEAEQWEAEQRARLDVFLADDGNIQRLRVAGHFLSSRAIVRRLGLDAAELTTLRTLLVLTLSFATTPPESP